MIKKQDKLEVVDNLAFFRWKNNPEEWHRFWQLLDEKEKAYVESLLPEINDRIKNHYEAAARGAREARAARRE